MRPRHTITVVLDTRIAGYLYAHIENNLEYFEDNVWGKGMSKRDKRAEVFACEKVRDTLYALLASTTDATKVGAS